MNLKALSLSRTYVAIVAFITLAVLLVDYRNELISDEAVRECPKIGGKLAKVNGLLTQQYICIPNKK